MAIIRGYAVSIRITRGRRTSCIAPRAQGWNTLPRQRCSSGSKNSYIATLVERHTRYVMLAKVANKDTQTIVSTLIKQAKTLPTELSLTWDRGKELADHRRFTLATNIDVYFCDPQSPWQRGSNELNERPRKTLGFETPAERFNACVASTG